MEMNPKMKEWAERRVCALSEKARLAQNALRTAQRDLGSILSGRPSGSCLDRYFDWKASRPKHSNKEINRT